MSVRSRQLGAVTSGIVGLVTDLYTVPKDRTAVVRQVVLSNTGTASMGAQVVRRRAGVTIPLAAAPAVGVGLVHLLSDLFLVLHPQDVLSLVLVSGTAGTGTTHTYAASAYGALLDGNPPDYVP